MIAPANIGEYAQPYKQYFYQFEELGEVLSITGGQTICYTQFLFETLESLGNRGAPPLGTLLLAIIATGNDALNMLAQVRAIIDKPDISNPAEKELPFFKTAFKFLETLSKLPPQYRQGARRLQVLQSIFLNAHNLIAERRIKGFITEYKAGGGLSALPYPVPLTSGILTRDLRPLAQLHYKFKDVDELLARLSAVPELVDIPFETAPLIAEGAKPKDFIEELEQHPDTFHAASLVRRIWSGLAIPFHSNHPSAQPLGGVADISNRGELDKLLLSEHANDEMLFLSRLANGEALYINRETPPQTSKLKRILLIDSSLQAWGTPRTLSYALLLAIARHPKTDIDCIGFAVGERCEAISFATVHEVISSLQLLDTGLNASSGLEDFFRNTLPKGRHEVLFLTSPQGMRQPPIQNILSEQSAEISYCITASEEGECTVYKKGGAGIKHLQSFTLPLNELWKSPPKETTPSQEITTQSNLPSDYPILFPAPRHIKQVLVTPDGQQLMITAEKSLMKNGGESIQYYTKGWRLLIDRLPSGDCIYEIGNPEGDKLLLLCFSSAKQELYLINLSTEAEASVVLRNLQIPKGGPSFLATKEGFMLLIKGGSRHLKLVEMQDGSASVVMENADLSPTEERSLLQQYTTRQIEKAKLKPPQVSHGSVMKHLKRAFISDTDLLVINSHALEIVDNTIIQLTSGKSTQSIGSKLTGKGNIAFGDRSTISINPNGMLILKSSSGLIPDIYIPAMIDRGLGVATKDHFAGSSLYNPGLVGNDQLLELNDFYNRYIRAFIDHIVQHAASPKA